MLLMLMLLLLLLLLILSPLFMRLAPMLLLSISRLPAPHRPKTQASVAALSDDRALRSLKALQLQAQVPWRCPSHAASHTSHVTYTSHVTFQGLNTSNSSSSGYGYSQQQQQQHSNSSSSAWASGGSSKMAPSIKDRSLPLGHHSSNTSDLYATDDLFCYQFL
jgi:hypothetical protein